MSPITDPDFLQSVRSEYSAITPIVLLKIDHDDLPSPIYLASSREAITSNSIQYSAISVEGGSPPDSVPTEAPTAEIVLGDMEGTVVQSLLSLSGKEHRATLELSTIGSHDLDTIQRGPYLLQIVSMNSSQSQGMVLQLGAEPVLEEPYPKDTIGPRSFPNLHFAEASQ